jgi:hypothetical protein
MRRGRHTYAVGDQACLAVSWFQARPWAPGAKKSITNTAAHYNFWVRMCSKRKFGGRLLSPEIVLSLPIPLKTGDRHVSLLPQMRKI